MNHVLLAFPCEIGVNKWQQLLFLQSRRWVNTEPATMNVFKYPSSYYKIRFNNNYNRLGIGVGELQLFCVRYDLMTHTILFINFKSKFMILFSHATMKNVNDSSYNFNSRLDTLQNMLQVCCFPSLGTYT